MNRTELEEIHYAHRAERDPNLWDSEDLDTIYEQIRYDFWHDDTWFEDDEPWEEEAA